MLYVDPGTGALIWQSLVAIAVGFLFTLRRIFGFAWKKKDEPETKSQHKDAS